MAADTEFEKKKERHASGQSTQSTDTVSNYIPTPPDGGYGWVVVIAAFFIHVIVDGITFTFGVFYMSFLDEFGQGKGRTALVGSLLSGFYLMIGPIAGALINKFGCRPVAVTGSIIATLAFALSTMAPSLEILMITYGIMGGIGFGLLYLPCIIAVSFYFQTRRAIATGIAVCGAGVGGFAFAPFGKWLLDVMDWRNAMLVVAGLALQGCVLAMLLRPLEPPKKKRRDRTKNVLDRLKEQAKKHRRGRQESECSMCGKDNHRDSMMRRIQEVKLAREQALHEEDGESVLGSSMLNSQSVSPSRTNSFMNRQELGGTTAKGADTSPARRTSRQEAAYKGDATNLPPISAEEEPQSIGDNAIPTIVIRDEQGVEGEERVCSDEKTRMLQEVEGGGGDQGGAKSPAHKNSKKKGVLPDRVVMDIHSNGVVNVSLPGNLPHYSDGKSNGSVVPNGHSPGNQLAQPASRTDNKCSSSSALWDKRIHQLKSDVKFEKPKDSKADYARPLYRKDIFYSGSVLNIPQFRSQPDVHTYVKSVTSIPAEVPPDQDSCMWRLLRIPKAAKDTLREMLDVSLFKEPIFILCVIANFFAFIGIFIPFVYIVDRAKHLGISENKAALLLSVIGVTNMIGRVVSGAMADCRRVNPLLLHNVAVVTAGLACIFNMFSTGYPQMIVFAVVFGYCIATYICLTSIIMCSLLGMERLTNAFGLLCCIRGIASIVGPPIAGFVYDATKDFDKSFHVGGVVLVIAGLLFSLLHLPYFQRRSAQAQQQAEEIFEVIFDDDLILTAPPPPPEDSDDDDEAEPELVRVDRPSREEAEEKKKVLFAS